MSAIATAGYRRQEENKYIAVPWEIVEKYPTAVQHFLGYSVSRPYGGSVKHMEPLDYLKVKGDWSKYIPVDLIQIVYLVNAAFGSWNLLWMAIISITKK